MLGMDSSNTKRDEHHDRHEKDTFHVIMDVLKLKNMPIK